MTTPAAEDFDFRKLVRDVSAELALPPDFLSNLLHEDDWSFVVKSHALVEGAVTHLLVESTGDARLATFFQRLQLNGEGGKIAAARALELMTPWQVRFLRALSPMRNRLAHRATHFNFDLAAHVATLSADQLNELVLNLSLQDAPVKEDVALTRAHIEYSCKLHLWMLVVYFLGDVYLTAKWARLDREGAQIDADIARSSQAVIDAIFAAVERDGKFEIRAAKPKSDAG